MSEATTALTILESYQDPRFNRILPILPKSGYYSGYNDAFFAYRAGCSLQNLVETARVFVQLAIDTNQAFTDYTNGFYDALDSLVWATDSARQLDA